MSPIGACGAARLCPETESGGAVRDLRYVAIAVAILALASCASSASGSAEPQVTPGASLHHEMALLVEAFDYGWADLQWFTINAMKSAFIPFDDRLEIINNQIKPGYVVLLG